MPLISLPIELLTRILEFVDDACPLTRVSLACRTLNNVAEPLLYQSFSQRNASSMGLLARVIISRPHLARYIRSFKGSTIRPGVRIPDPTREGINLRTVSKTYPTHTQFEALRRSLPDSVYGEEFCTAWYGNLTNWFDNWDAFLGFLLHVCSRSLIHIMFWTPGIMSPYLYTVLEQAIKEQNSSVEQAMLSNLRKVDLKYDSKASKRDCGISIDFIVPFLRLKSVDVVSITGIHNDVALTSHFSEQHVFAIKDLILTDNRISATSLEKFLGCFTSLKYFEYQHTSMRGAGARQFRPNIIANGLHRSKHCLESFLLSQNRQLNLSAITLQAGEFCEPVGSLQEFERLRVINVDACVLLGPKQKYMYDEGLRYSVSQCMAAVATLPATLELLHISKCRIAIFRFLEHLLPKDGPSPSSKLRSIHLLFEIKALTLVRENDWESWKKRALEKGIVITSNKLFA
ncbi:hypothetical protein N431DRAFT_481849 [Stipitochalara longipes BDJ]|nr:hypothetical protein N431DRAFT_481849 [Stipitochalara longipes BDJ]